MSSDESADDYERSELLQLAADLLTIERYGATKAAKWIAEAYGMSFRNAQRVIAEAREHIAAIFREELPSKASMLEAMQLDVFKGAHADGDWTACNGAIRNLCTVYGIGAKVTIQSGGGGVDALLEAIKTSPGQRDAEIAALEAKEREDSSGGAEPG